MLLNSDLWVAALIRRAQLEGANAAVVRRGDARAGTVLVKTYDTSDRSARVYAEAFGPDGDRMWIQPATGTESEIDAFIERQRGYDPDLWVVEIEDRQGRHFITEPVAR